MCDRILDYSNVLEPKKKAKIRLEERDYHLGLESENWPMDAPINKDWKVHVLKLAPEELCGLDQEESEEGEEFSQIAFHYRILDMGGDTTSENSRKPAESLRERHETGQSSKDAPADDLKEKGEKSPYSISDRNRMMGEVLLRFPSAPIYNPYKDYDHQYELERRHLHTIRLLIDTELLEAAISDKAKSSDDHESGNEGIGQNKIERVFLMLNGLNEIEDFSFFYDSARRIIMDDPSACCLIVPVPGHLTRFSFPPQYAEKPLDRFLADPIDLFRQYLRFMVETRWLLSALVPLASYRRMVGLSLLAEWEEEPGTEPQDLLKKSRNETKVISHEIENEWNGLIDDASNKAKTVRERGYHVNSQQGEATANVAFPTITILRRLIGRKGESRGSRASAPVSSQIYPHLHVYGYSLGGFLSQCVYFTWPFAITSCTTICSGGWLKNVTLTRFAHKEEWLRVLYNLRYELEDSMLFDRIKLTQSGTGEERVLGVPKGNFAYLVRVFYEVFLQDFPETYRSRISECGHRMFFVVGGEDPIIRPESLQDASPEGGINMLEIANVGHFLAKHKDFTGEWSKYWFPQLISNVVTFAKFQEEVLAASLAKSWFGSGYGNIQARLAEGEKGSAKPEKNKVENGEDIPLAAEEFRLLLDEMSACVAPASNSKSPTARLFIARNRPPTAFFPSAAAYITTPTLHYRDSKWAEYLKGVRDRSDALIRNRDRITSILPSRAYAHFIRNRPLLPPNHYFHPDDSLKQKEFYQDKWKKFEESWREDFGKGAFRAFRPAEHAVCESLLNHERAFLNRYIERYGDGKPQMPIVNTLPDVWVLIQDEYFSDIDMVLEQEDIDRCEDFSRRRLAFSKLIWRANTLLASKVELFTDNPWGKVALDLKNQKLVIVKVSRAEFNSRYRGSRILSAVSAGQLLIHLALCFVFSEKIDTYMGAQSRLR